MNDMVLEDIVATDAISVSNSTEGDDEETHGCRLYKFIVLTNVGGLVCIFGFLGNLIAFVVFQKDSMKTSTSFLFQALSVIDNVLLLTAFPVYCIPALFKYLYPEQYGSHDSAQHAIALVYVFPLAFLAQTATIWVTVLVGVNRYIAVCRPFQAARLCTVRQAKLQLAVVLSLVILYSIPRFAQARLVVVPATPDEDEGETVTSSATTTSFGDQTNENGGWMLVPQHTALGEDPLYWIVYDNILYTVVMLVLPLTALTALNVRLVRELRALRRKRAAMQGTGRQSTGGSSSASSQDSNVTLVLVIVVLVFIVCQTPALATQLFWTLLDNSARSCGGFQYYFGCVSNLLVVANSAANFPIYLLFNTRFRLVLRQTVCPAAEVTSPVASSAGGGRVGGSSSAQRQLLGGGANGFQTVCPAAASGSSVETGGDKTRTTGTTAAHVGGGGKGTLTVCPDRNVQAT